MTPENDRSQAVDELFGLTYQQLRRLARRARSGWQGDPTLGTTALIHEAYLKLARDRDRTWDRTHFLAVASRAMRQVLINYAEHKRADKREGALHRTTLDGLQQPPEATEELLALENALQELERRNPRLGQVVECRFFGGLSVEETAEVTATSPATVKRDWRLAQAFLQRTLTGSSAEASEHDEASRDT
jgi:RNA polymerase sigma factor (TIGR02999 family)